MNAGWFDSESQVKDCSNMKRAMTAHEETLIAVHVMILMETLQWWGRLNEDEKIQIDEALKIARGSVQDSIRFRQAWGKMDDLLLNKQIGLKIKSFIAAGKHNRFLQFLVKYSDMVLRLFTFAEANRSRNWLLHLDSFEDLIPDCASMDRNKYRLWSAIYIADNAVPEAKRSSEMEIFYGGSFLLSEK